MSISSALNNAISGLSVNSRMAEVVSSNLSNALTEGYARREVDLSSANLGGKGAGVRVTGIRRVTDPVILADRREADARTAGSKMQSDTLARVEQAMGAPGAQTGLAARLAKVETALIDAATDPSSPQRLGQVVTRLTELTTAFHEASTVIQLERQAADTVIADGVDQLNTDLKQVEQLNADIARASRRGLDGAALQDERQRVIDRIAVLVPIRTQSRPDGAVALYSSQGATLIDGKAAQFGFQRSPTIVADMTLQSGGLAPIMTGGSAMPDGFGNLTGGSLQAAFRLRDQTLVSAQADLDLAAADLVARFSNPAVDPTILAGGPGLLTDRGAPLDPADHIGLSGRLSVNASVDIAAGGSVARLRDGVNATTVGPAGDATLINRLRDALQVDVTPVPGARATTAFHRLNDLSAEWGGVRLRADEAVAFASSRQDMMRQAETALGVDSDVELQELIKIEQAYAANAKLLQAVEAMMQRLTEI